MKTILGTLLVLGGIVLGLYVGIWVCFVGGIVDVIQQIRAEELSPIIIAWGIAKIMLAGFFGWLSAVILVFPGWVLLTD